MNVDCKEHILARLKEFLHSQDIFGQDQVKNIDIYINMLSNKNYIRDQIELMKERE